MENMNLNNEVLEDAVNAVEKIESITLPNFGKKAVIGGIIIGAVALVGVGAKYGIPKIKNLFKKEKVKEEPTEKTDDSTK